MMKPIYQQDHWLLNRVMSGGLFVWYAMTEFLRLPWARTGQTHRNITPDLVSVIIPTHNRANLLMDLCLPSVLAQTHTNIEVIVIAHWCEDDTERRVKALNDPRIRLNWIWNRTLHYPDTPENRWFAGPVDPINLGLERAKGDWVARVDDDDTWEPDHLEKSLAAAKKRKLEFISSAHDTHDGRVSPYWLDAHTKVGGTQTWLYRSYLRFFKYNRHCWRKRANRVNDTDIQERMHRAGVRMGYLDDVHSHVYPRPGETTVGLAAYIDKG